MSAPQSSPSLILSQPDLGPFPPHIWDTLASIVIGPKLRSDEGHRVYEQYVVPRSHEQYPGTSLSLVSRGMADVVTPCLYQFLIIYQEIDYLRLLKAPAKLRAMVKSLDIRVFLVDVPTLIWSQVYQSFPNLERFQCLDVDLHNKKSPFLPKLRQAGSGILDWCDLDLFNVNVNLERIMLKDPAEISELNQWAIEDRERMIREYTDKGLSVSDAEHNPCFKEDYEKQEASIDKYRGVRNLHVRGFKIEKMEEAFAGVKKFFELMHMPMEDLELLDINAAHDHHPAKVRMFMDERVFETLIDTLITLDFPALKQIQITMVVHNDESWTIPWNQPLPFPDLMDKLFSSFSSLCVVYLEVRLDEESPSGEPRWEGESKAVYVKKKTEADKAAAGFDGHLVAERVTLDDTVYELVPAGMVRRGNIVRWWEEGGSEYGGTHMSVQAVQSDHGGKSWHIRPVDNIEVTWI